MRHPLDQPLVTERLTLRPHTTADAERLVELDADPAVRAHVDMPEPPTLDHVRGATLPRWEAFRSASPGHGYWIAELTAPGRFIGWFHLREPRHGTPHRPGDLELGFRIMRECWGLGYATEGARRLLRHGFESLAAPRIVAAALAPNAASINVMKKLGMSLEREWLYKDAAPAVVYVLPREQAM